VSPAWHGFLVRMQQLDIALFALRIRQMAPSHLGLWWHAAERNPEACEISSLSQLEIQLGCQISERNRAHCRFALAHVCTQIWLARHGAAPSMAMSAAWRGRGGCCMRNRGWQHRATQHV
jgi:hypothetical protein